MALLLRVTQRTAEAMSLWCGNFMIFPILSLQKAQAQDAKSFAEFCVVLTGSNGPWTVDVSFDHSSATYKLEHFDQDLHRRCALYIFLP